MPATPRRLSEGIYREVDEAEPQVACDTSLSRESVDKGLSGDRNPTLDTVLRVVGALGLNLRAEVAPASGSAGSGTSAHR